MCVCILALVSWHAEHIFSAPYNTVICSLSGSSTFSHIISQTLQFLEKASQHKMCVLISPKILSEKFLILRRIQQDIIMNVLRSSCGVPVILVKF